MLFILTKLSTMQVYVKYSGREVNEVTPSNKSVPPYFIYKPADLLAYVGVVSQKFIDYSKRIDGNLLSFKTVNIDE